jgi:7-carboxy-7-deazaguanine synthase
MNNKKFIIEMSKVIQGEGKLAGVPHYLIRTTGCNMRCQFSNSVCDTPYASIHAEKGRHTIEDVRDYILSDRVSDKPHFINHVMITGGEPAIQGKKLEELILELSWLKLHITVETAGTATINWSTAIHGQPPVNLMSISPKLSNSHPDVGGRHGYFISEKDAERHRKLARNFDAMADLIKNSQDYYLKFVISNEDNINEALNVANHLNVPREKIYFMPEGTTDKILSKVRKMVIAKCIELGVNYTDRLHIIAFGEERGV